MASGALPVIPGSECALTTPLPPSLDLCLGCLTLLGAFCGFLDATWPAFLPWQGLGPLAPSDTLSHPEAFCM